MKFEFIEHTQLPYQKIEKIIGLKNKVWPYPLASHQEWIKENLNSGDIHLLLWKDHELIGYLNLVCINGSVDAIGIGNVVVDPSFQGENLGLLLMNLCDYYLAKLNKPGILICKDRVKGFYIKCGWQIFPNKVYLGDKLVSYHVLTRRFETRSLKKLIINRIF